MRFFRGLGINWTKELDFVILPALVAVGLFVLEVLYLSGNSWARYGVSPPVLLGLAVLTVAWTLMALREQAGLLGGGDFPAQNRGLHNAWRARTIAWDILIIAGASIGLVIVSWAGPARVIPPSDTAVLEITVLVVTVGLLATFARYSAMAFSTDIDTLVTRMDGLSRRESEQRAEENERLAATFSREVGKLIQHVDRQVSATESGLKSVATQLELISVSLAAQAEMSKEIATAQQAAVDGQRREAEAAAERERQRREAAVLEASVRRDQIRPLFRMRLRWTGVLTHSLHLDLQNEGGEAQALRVEVMHGRSAVPAKLIPNIPSGGSHTLELGDVTTYEQSARFEVSVFARDMDGNRSSFTAAVDYARDTGFWGQTKRIRINPGGWVRMGPA